jgi:hypothetical protein
LFTDLITSFFLRYLFNDSSVHRVNVNQIKTAGAYVLFYRRRKAKKSTPSKSDPSSSGEEQPTAQNTNTNTNTNTNSSEQHPTVESVANSDHMKSHPHFDPESDESGDPMQQ